MNIRRRLALLYATLLALILLVLSLSLYLTFGYHLRAEVDDSLVSWAAWARNTLPGAATQDGAVQALMNEDPQMIEGFVLYQRKGTASYLAAPTLGAADLALLTRSVSPLLASKQTGFIDAELSLGPYRVFVSGVLVLGRSLAHVDQTLRWLLLTMMTAWIVAVALCTLATWRFVGQTLLPVNRMTIAALDIADSADLSRRLRTPISDDEFGRLAGSLNCMLASLEKAYETRKQFLADASHELRTPLTSIRANLDFVVLGTAAPAQEREAAILDVRDEVERMTRLVNELLLLARTEATRFDELAPLNLTALIGDLVEQFQGRLRTESRRLSVQLPATPMWVLGSRDQMFQALMILLDNALKYSQRGSCVRILATFEPNRYTIAVEDDGPGIPEDELPLVSRRFYRASNVRGMIPGTGLGLAIVRSVLHLHDGQLELKNRISGGLCASISLPGHSVSHEHSGNSQSAFSGA